LFVALVAGCEDEKRIVCGTVAQCPGDPTCVDIQCVGHICTYNDLPDQAPSPKNVAGDCKQITCDGMGGALVSIDDTDLPAANGACMAARCDQGVASVGPAQAGTACGSGMHCDNTGSCVECISPQECPGVDNTCQARTCLNNACGITYTASGTSCGSGLHCDGAGNCS